MLRILLKHSSIRELTPDTGIESLTIAS
jgi:hypothetical protein